MGLDDKYPTINILSHFLKDMMEEVHDTNLANGWFDTSRSFGDDIALLHSEVSEMLEEFRIGRVQTDIEPTGKPVGVGSEAADILIRLLDTCKRYGIDLDHEYAQKISYNKTRSYRHGDKEL